MTFLLTGFAAIAAFLAMLGIYGVTAYAVQQRHKEVAIRVALGASERAVDRNIPARGRPAPRCRQRRSGLIGGATASRVLRNQVFGVQGFDASTYALACALLLAAGFTAVFWAARRAALAHPVSALNAN